MRLTTLFGLLLCVLLGTGVIHAQQLLVDCDAGDDLAQALEQAVSSGLTWIAVEGTCEGNFELESPVSIQLDGNNATLVSPDEGVVFRIGGPGWVTLDGFEIRSGSVGVQSVGADARAIVRHCDVHDNGYGVATSQGARLSTTFSDIHDNNIGVFCGDHSECSASFATIRDNLGGARVEGQSDLQSFGTVISGNTGSGVLVDERSKASFDRSTFLENGAFHIALNDRSHGLLQNGTVLGGPGDETPIALAVVLLSSAETSRFGEPVELHGHVLAADSSYLVLDAAQVRGDVEIIDFAEVKLVRSTVDGSVACQSGGNATCGEGSTARIEGCASARPRCSPHPSNRRARYDEVLDQMQRFKDDDAAGPRRK